ncbi:MAG: protein translocase subunit SecD [Planctomycetota bacterium]
MLARLSLLCAYFAAIAGLEIFYPLCQPVLRGIVVGIYIIAAVILYYFLNTATLRKFFWIMVPVTLLFIAAVPTDLIPTTVARNDAMLKQLDKDIAAYKADPAKDGGWQGLLDKYNLTVLHVPKTDDLERLRRMVAIRDNTTLKFGTDLKGGFEILYEVLPVKDEAIAAIADDTLSIIRQRIDNSGLAGNTVQTVGRNRILVQVPGYNREEALRVKNIIKQRGHLAFRLVSPNHPLKEQFEEIAEYNRAHPEAPRPYPDGHELLELTTVDTKNGRQVRRVENLLVGTHEYLTGDDLAQVYASQDNIGKPAVGMEFTLAGRKKMGDVTGENIQERLAIVLDGRLKSAPVIQARITRSGIISGDFTQQEVREIIDILRAGSLDIRMKELSEYSVEASLGDRSIKNGIRATIVGALAVFGFMAIYYMKAGLVCDAALFMCMLLIVGTMALFQVTLTLSGIAGLVLTLGMAVDGNILIYERIREELKKRRAHKPELDREDLRQSINKGFGAAFWTIFDSQLTTLITAVILVLIGTELLKAFGITLSIGIIMSMFGSLVITRVLLQFLIESGNITNDLKMFAWLSNPAFKFLADKMGVTGDAEADKGPSRFRLLAWRPQLVSIALFIGAVALFVGRGDSKYGVDFTGGSITKVAFRTGITAEQLRADLSAEFPDSRIQRFTDDQKAGSQDRKDMVTQATYSIYLPEKDPQAELTGLLKTPEVYGPDKAVSVEPFRYTEAFRKELADRVLTAYDRDRGAGLVQLDNPRAFDEFFTPLDEALIARVKGTFGAAAEAADRLPVARFVRFAAFTGGDGLILVAVPQTGREQVKQAILARYADTLAPDGLPQVAAGQGAGEFDLTMVLEKSLSAEAVKSALEQQGVGRLVLKDVTVASAGGTTYTVHLRVAQDKAVSSHELREDLKTRLPLTARFLGDNSIGTAVAGELRERAIIGLILAFIAIIIYITVRFEFNFSIGAVVALVHDAVISAGVVMAADLLGFPCKLDLTVLAAILTIIGYSINDTIVVFDRIREKMPRRDGVREKTQNMTRRKLAVLMDQAINETLSRTIMTSLTTLLATLALVFLGGPVIFGFAFCMSFGIILGTYSSIYVASPLVITTHWLREVWGRRKGTGTGHTEAK